MKEFADSLGLPVEKVKRRFTSNRTDHIKLYNMLKKGKSGQGSKRLTPLQQFKLDNYKFVQRVYVPRTTSKTLGQIGLAEESESEASEEEDVEMEEQQPGTSTVGETEQDLESFPQCKQPSGRPSKKLKSEKRPHRQLSEVLEDLLQDSMKEKRDLTDKIETMQGLPAGKVNERDAWGEWLLSMQREIPISQWREYQRETFEVAMRHVQRQGQAQVNVGSMQFPSAGTGMLPPYQPPLFAPQAPLQPVGPSPGQQYQRAKSIPPGQSWDINAPFAVGVPSGLIGQAYQSTVMQSATPNTSPDMRLTRDMTGGVSTHLADAHATLTQDSRTSTTNVFTGAIVEPSQEDLA